MTFKNVMCMAIKKPQLKIHAYKHTITITNGKYILRCRNNFRKLSYKLNTVKNIRKASNRNKNIFFIITALRKRIQNVSLYLKNSITNYKL